MVRMLSIFTYTVAVVFATVTACKDDDLSGGAGVWFFFCFLVAVAASIMILIGED